MKPNGSTERARKLRRDFTPAERKLWAALRNRQLMGYKFVRQFPIVPYIVDFCSREKHLVIELDGDIHAFQEEYDQERETYLDSRGYTTIRFTNREIFSEINAVLVSIQDTLDSL